MISQRHGLDAGLTPSLSNQLSWTRQWQQRLDDAATGPLLDDRDAQRDGLFSMASLHIQLPLDRYKVRWCLSDLPERCSRSDLSWETQPCLCSEKSTRQSRSTCRLA